MTRPIHHVPPDVRVPFTSRSLFVQLTSVRSERTAPPPEPVAPTDANPPNPKGRTPVTSSTLNRTHRSRRHVAILAVGMAGAFRSAARNAASLEARVPPGLVVVVVLVELDD